MSTNLATLLKEARVKARLTQEQLAKKVAGGLTANDISRAERGMDTPTEAQLKAIAKITGVTQKSLIDAAKSARSKTSASAKKTAAAKTAAAKKAGSTGKKDEYTLTATEKKLIDAYRSASAENRKLALNLLQGKAVEDNEGMNIGSILQNGLSSGLSGVLETLISGLGQ